MRAVPATEAKARLAELLRTVERGETVAITRHGQTVAHMIPVPEVDRASRKQAVADFRRRRSEWQSAGMSIEDILEARHLGHRM
ncbi:MAG: type II toxin-antitoxin system prevent-host-death family antitoxin [Alphaproteobacteria bacterium]|nr:type II toxin-antitoxin system prevent-host-death family antitoxin [Alphaproteobacteria bacterium]